MRRRLIQVALLLLLGAIVNVAVAWGCMIRYQFHPTPVDAFSPDESAAIWERLADPGWTAEPTYGQSRCTFGARERHVEAGLWNVIVAGGKPATTSKYMLDEICAGWPMLGLQCVQRADQGSPAGWIIEGRLDIPVEIGGHPWIYVPWSPIWPGFAINTVFYAAVLWLVFAAPFALRKRRRIKRGVCPKCAYDLRNRPADSTTCPECGTSLPSPSR